MSGCIQISDLPCLFCLQCQAQSGDCFPVKCLGVALFDLQPGFRVNNPIFPFFSNIRILYVSSPLSSVLLISSCLIAFSRALDTFPPLCSTNKSTDFNALGSNINPWCSLDSLTMRGGGAVFIDLLPAVRKSFPSRLILKNSLCLNSQNNDFFFTLFHNRTGCNLLVKGMDKTPHTTSSRVRETSQLSCLCRMHGYHTSYLSNADRMSIPVSSYNSLAAPILPASINMSGLS